MAKRPSSKPRQIERPPQPVPSVATAARFDGGAVKIEIVFQPEDAARLSDQLVNALIRNGRRR